MYGARVQVLPLFRNFNFSDPILTNSLVLSAAPDLSIRNTTCYWCSLVLRVDSRNHLDYYVAEAYIKGMIQLTNSSK